MKCTLTLERFDKQPKATIGKLYVGPEFLCYTLEDTDRLLKQTDELARIEAVKIFGLTAIPSGTYKFIINKSNRFSALAGKDVFLPLLLDVKGWTGVRIHSGNSDVDTEGCILVGLVYDKNLPDYIGMSRVAMQKLMDRLSQFSEYEIIIK